MKTLITIALFSSMSFATCFMTRTVCAPNNNFQNTYEIKKVTCSAPGGPVSTTKTLIITNDLTSIKFRKKFNFTRDHYLQAKINKIGKTNYLEIDDRSLESAENINISTTRPLELIGYTCKETFR